MFINACIIFLGKRRPFKNDMQESGEVELSDSTGGTCASLFDFNSDPSEVSDSDNAYEDASK